MNILSVIPARMGSSRFYGKPLKKILGKPMLERVYKNVKKCKLIDEVYVATCDKEIYDFLSTKRQAFQTSSVEETIEIIQHKIIPTLQK